MVGEDRTRHAHAHATAISTTPQPSRDESRIGVGQVKALKNNQVLSHGTQDSLAKGVGLVVRSADDTSPEPDWMSVDTAAAMGDAQKLSAGLLGNQAAMQAMAGNQAAMMAMMAGNPAGMQMAPTNQVMTGAAVEGCAAYLNGIPGGLLDEKCAVTVPGHWTEPAAYLAALRHRAAHLLHS